MREIERLPRQITNLFKLMKFEQIFSLQCQTEQAASQEAHHKTFIRMTFPWTLSSTQHQGNGGAGRDRTDDILLAKQALSQLSYGP
jgi:hypothetical protein